MKPNDPYRLPDTVKERNALEIRRRLSAATPRILKKPEPTPPAPSGNWRWFVLAAIVIGLYLLRFQKNQHFIPF